MTSEAVTTSYGRNKGLLGATSTSSRLEERPLLSETEARFLDPDDVIILASPQHPIKARRIKYFEDPLFSAMMDAQEGVQLPYPPQQRPEAVVGPMARGESGEVRGSEDIQRIPAQASRPMVSGSWKLKLADDSGRADGRTAGIVDAAYIERGANVPKTWKALIAEGEAFEMG